VRLTRVYVDAALTAGARGLVSGSAANHIARVLRLGAGDALTLFDGRGGEYAARIELLRKDAVEVAIGEHVAVERESPLAVTLAQGISRGERMDWVMQKATELGVRRIVWMRIRRRRSFSIGTASWSRPASRAAETACLNCRRRPILRNFWQAPRRPRTCACCYRPPVACASAR
jgi:16S rRNA (uracil1498-N3)-methyltransferase